jgi:hypothetical protein
MAALTSSVDTHQTVLMLCFLHRWRRELPVRCSGTATSAVGRVRSTGTTLMLTSSLEPIQTPSDATFVKLCRMRNCGCLHSCAVRLGAVHRGLGRVRGSLRILWRRRSGSSDNETKTCVIEIDHLMLGMLASELTVD